MERDFFFFFGYISKTIYFCDYANNNNIRT